MLQNQDDGPRIGAPSGPIVVLTSLLVALVSSTLHFMVNRGAGSEFWQTEVIRTVTIGSELLAGGPDSGWGAGGAGSDDPSSFKRWAADLLANPDYLCLAFISPEGRVAGVLPQGFPIDGIKRNPGLACDVLENGQLKDRSRTVDVYVASRSISGSLEETPGRLAVVARRTPSQIVAELMKREWGIFAVSLTSSIVLGALGAWWVRRRHGLDYQRLIRPLDVSDHAWRELLPVNRDDAVGTLARTLDELYQEVLDRRQEVATLKRDIDSKVSERVRQITGMLKKAEQKAWMDPLTKLGNRRLLDDRLEQIFSAQQAAGDDLTVVMMDLDHFKPLNDTLGHAAGDELLAFVGDLLRSSLRASDIGIRYGGDEFILLLLGVGSEEGAGMAERIRKLFVQRCKVLGIKPAPSISAGVASLQADQAVSGADLIKLADKSLYSAKRNGRSRVAVGC